MKKHKILTVALILILTGAVLFFIGFLVNERFPSPIVKTEETKIDIEEPFTDIVIDVGSCNIAIEKTDGAAYVTTQLCGAIACEITAEHGVLTIRTDEFMHFGLHLYHDKITVYLPEGTCGRADIGLTSGSLAMNGISLDGDLTVSVTSGEVQLSALTCGGKITAKATSGGIRLDAVSTPGSVDLNLTSGRIDIKDLGCSHLAAKTTSGSIRLDHCDARTMELTARSGSISGSVVGQKVFECSATSGSIHVPDTTEGGLCRIRTTSGDIHIEIAE